MSFFFLKKTNLHHTKKTSHWIHSFINRDTKYKKGINKNWNTFKEIKQLVKFIQAIKDNKMIG